MTKPVTVLISSRNRPLYLWACLDALYARTRIPCRFILVDMASDDPLVEKVLAGFERRGMFDKILRSPQNNLNALAELVFGELESWGPYFAYIESDVVVEDAEPCWLERMTSLMESNPRLGMLGSAIDKRDFLEPAAVEHLREDRDEAHWRALIKADSPERGQDVSSAEGKPLFRPHNPAGRLLMLRSEAIKEVGVAQDSVLDRLMREAGYETAVATKVRHRHLSLVQLFDYPDYDMSARNKFMSKLDEFKQGDGD
ncbi:glycosyltransferase family 2 protein [Methylocystis heyeri]|uniref:Glycosyltransferase n=1 Tax=Methylocystis heyeri TaxID=391905 RepID=A0A6B8KB13_9HYPH|nr:glycosyltransferase [Methylocystis heyeri]QGM44702.1 glycosyltransferase [Methylocystis heyeri]